MKIYNNFNIAIDFNTCEFITKKIHNFNANMINFEENDKNEIKYFKNIHIFGKNEIMSKSIFSIDLLFFYEKIGGIDKLNNEMANVTINLNSQLNQQIEKNDFSEFELHTLFEFYQENKINKNGKLN